MDLRKVRKLIEIFHDSELEELEIREGEESIRLTRSKPAAPEPVYIQPQPSIGPYAQPQEPSIERPPAAEEELLGGHAVRSPMVGTFFRSASPGDPPFIEVGDQVESGQALCLIEAMKIFNQIDADVSGTVVQILKDNGEPVEYGEVLFLIEE